MRGNKLAIAATLFALPATALLTPVSAVAKSNPTHHNTHHHGSHHGKGAYHKTRTVSFYAHVVRSSAQGLVVRTTDGKVLAFSARQIKSKHLPKHQNGHGHRGHSAIRALGVQVSSGNVVVDIIGLQPGVLVQITETIDGNGNVTITITLPPPSSQQSTSGVVTDVGDDAFTIQATDGSELELHMASDALSSLNLQSCDTVDVAYHQDAGVLIADTVNVTGSSSAGDCAPTYDARGQITQVSAGSLTISGDNGPVTFSVDPSSDLTTGFQVGDLVDVSYTQLSDGTLSATDVQFVEENASGRVTAVTTSASGGSLTLTTDDTGQSETFIADPSAGVEIHAHAFNGVSVGDQVELTYHQAAGQLVADTVEEQ